jgi:hypothetical protein
MLKSWLIAITVGLMQLLAAGQALAVGNDVQQITMVLKKQFEKPEAPLSVAPISIEGDFAVAGWSQGGRGGRAFLQRDRQQWYIAVCGGSGLTQPDVLQSIGMKSDAAKRLAKAVVAAEAKLGAKQSKLFDGFEGMIKVDPATGHDAHGAHNAHGQHSGHGEPAPK